VINNLSTVFPIVELDEEQKVAREEQSPENGRWVRPGTFPDMRKVSPVSVCNTLIRCSMISAGIFERAGAHTCEIHDDEINDELQDLHPRQIFLPLSGNELDK
jgi:hypothetical protein